VPGDGGQVVYVWWDALTNYVTALGYGTDGPAYENWWVESAERVHVIGKGIVRFHAVYWLALLLSARLPLPTAVYVHDYLTSGGVKLSKTAGNAVCPAALAGRYGSDALRWWLLREVAPVGGTDFTVERLVDRANAELSNGVGNLVHRTLGLVHKYGGGQLPADPRGEGGAELAAACARLPGRVDRALSSFDFRAATGALCSVVGEANRVIEAEQPWRLARAAQAGDDAASQRLSGVLAGLTHSCRILATELSPFLPAGAQRLRELLHGNHARPAHPTFPRWHRTAAPYPVV
jgi:methionyl-tRNA synthetase